MPINRARLPLIDPGRRFIIFWTPRCGSTTTVGWFMQATGLSNETNKSWHSQRLEYGRGLKISDDDLMAIYRDPKVEKVQLTRDPYDRAVSSYYLALTSPPTSQWRHVAAKYPETNEHDRVSFAKFMDFLDTEDLKTSDLHWRLQSEQDWLANGFKIDRWIRCENLENDLADLARSYGLTAPVTRNSVTPKTEAAAPADLVNLDKRQLEAVLPLDKKGNASLPSYEAFLRRDFKERIARLYAQDFELLGYPT